MAPPVRRIRVFAPCFAEDRYCNAQQVNAREIFRRLDPERFECLLLSDGSGPAGVLGSAHVRARRLPPRRRSPRILHELLSGGHDIVLYLSGGWQVATFLGLRRRLGWPRASVLHPVEGDVAQFREVDPGVRRQVEGIIREADRVYPITPYVARTLEVAYGRKGAVIPVGVDRQSFRPREEPRRPGPCRVLAVGTVKSWKRPEYLLEAGKVLRDVEFTWVGEGESLEDCRAACPTNVRFVGSLGRDRLAEEYRAHDLLLHPSRMEGLPKVILEAMASGLPVVAFDAYEPFFLRETGSGRVVSTSEEMIAAVRDLARDEATRTAMGLQAREASAAFSWDRVAALWEREFLAVAGARA